ncbi:YqaA family protein [Pseudoalteromonas fenneropenaei]|uniref:YqaA family protein n=1 Tax=Pseudoalteromonas fenneropenaei TaxID=1737459 RepID=A0ABV7CPU6_9GAMM
MSYLALFISALLSATLLPGSSEVLLTALLHEQTAVLWMLWLVATAGNVLGSAINYGLGLQLERFKGRRWFPVSAPQLARAQQFFARYGRFSLLFAWLPVVGDPLTLLAGVIRLPFWQFFWLICIGKGARYALVIWLALQLFATT